MKRENDTCYLVVVPSDYEENGWTKDLFLATAYSRLCTQYHNEPVKFMMLSSQKQLYEVFQENEKEWQLTSRMNERDWKHMVDSYSIIVMSPSRSIGSDGKYAITTYHYYDNLENDGYMDGMISDVTRFIQTIEQLERKFLPFLRTEFREKFQQAIAIFANYSRLLAIREEFDCEKSSYNRDLQSEDFILVREAFLNETGLDLIYEFDADDDGNYIYCGMIDEVIWLVCTGTLVNWLI